MEYLKKLVPLNNCHPECIAVDSVLREMIGSKIINAGFIENCREGGMTFDFEKDGVVTRVVFGYNELGAWIEFKGELEAIDKE